MFMLALRLFLKDKSGGKQYCLIPFVGFNLGGWDIFEKDRISEKDALQ